MRSVDEALHAVAVTGVSIADRIAGALGSGEPLAVRLERLHDSTDPGEFRIRQIGWALAAAIAATTAVTVARPGLVVGLMLIVTAALIAFLAKEQRLAGRLRARSEALALELPVIAEQLAMLIASGWALTAALARIAERGHGAAAEDLRQVMSRISHGLDETAALREWAELSQVESVRQLVGVLALNRQTTELGRLISEEARSMRAESHRQLLALLEQRSQSVWIPVTVATLVPGVIFLSIPFLEVMRVFSSH
jgi:tight adherence protein C